MKKMPLILLTVFLFCLLTGCQSSEQKAAEEAINSIGDVTLDSAHSISVAREAYDHLSQ